MNLKLRFKIDEKVLIDIPGEKRFHISAQENLQFSDRLIGTQRDDDKPKGLWYAIGNEWIKYLQQTTNNFAEEYIYEIQINPEKMLLLDTDEKIFEFTKLYGKQKAGFKNFHIDWKTVAERYSGIEINPHSWKASRELEWYMTWSIASGCIWNKSAIKSFQLYSDNWRQL